MKSNNIHFQFSVLFLVISILHSDLWAQDIEKQKNRVEQREKDNLLKLLSPVRKREAYEAAVAIGSKDIKNKIEFSDKEKKALDKYIQIQIYLFGAKERGKSSDAKKRLLGLWYLAKERLLEAMYDKEIQVSEDAINCLVVMRNPDIITDIIQKVKDSEDAYIVKRGVYALGRMREISNCRISGRKLMSAEQSRKIAEEKIIPFLKSIQSDYKSSELKKTIQQALHMLSNPVDTRPKVIEGDEAEKLEREFQRSLKMKKK